MKVIMIAATTLCGRISPAPLGSELDRRFLERMRDETDASLMGSGTLRHADPEMRGTGGNLQQRLRAFITFSGDIPLQGKKVFASGPAPLVFAALERRQDLMRRLVGRAEVIALPAGLGGLSLAAAIAELERRGARSVLIEGGASFNYSALQQRVVDELMVTVTPKLSGDAQAASLVDGPAALGSPLLSLELISCLPQPSGEIFVHYQVCYEEENA
ncbi:MAG: RibD family protein [Proteobacteria bacterium]|nr:RibD family protein [Pseudomonadota bacterium]